MNHLILRVSYALFVSSGECNERLIGKSNMRKSMCSFVFMWVVHNNSISSQDRLRIGHTVPYKLNLQRSANIKRHEYTIRIKYII